MNSEKKNKINEPVETYEVNQNIDTTSEILHPVLIQLLEKSKENHAIGNSFSHEKAMQMYKEKIASK